MVAPGHLDMVLNYLKSRIVPWYATMADFKKDLPVTIYERIELILLILHKDEHIDIENGRELVASEKGEPYTKPVNYYLISNKGEMFIQSGGYEKQGVQRVRKISS